MEAVQWSQMEHALSTHKALLRSIYIHIFNTLYVVLIPLSPSLLGLGGCSCYAPIVLCVLNFLKYI